MYRGAFSIIQLINMIAHSFFTLLFNIALGLGIGWLAVEKWGAPSWVYIPFILLGVITGFYSMISFLLSATRSFERLERERAEKRRGGARTDSANGGAYVKNPYEDVDSEEDA